MSPDMPVKQFSNTARFLDEGLPNDVLLNSATERLWERCVAEFGSLAWARWSTMHRKFVKNGGVGNAAE